MCISSWFYLPEQGMKSFELLSRSSCFLIPRLSSLYQKNFHIATCAHVTHPFYYKKYYKEDFLDYITEEDVKVHLEIRNFKNGKEIMNFELEPKIHVHQKLDLSILHFKNENEFQYHQNKHNIAPVNISTQVFQPKVKDKMIDFIGFQLVDQELNKQKPSFTQGNINLIREDRIYSKTNEILDHGYCGGAVFEDSKCIGMIEGIVEDNQNITSDLTDHISKNAAFIPINEITNFLRKIEDFEIIDEDQNW
eukprot:gene12626-6530_t